MSTVITGDAIRLYQMMAQSKALGLEIKGLKFSKGSIYAHVKKQYGFKGNKQRVLEQLESKIVEEKAHCIARGASQG